MDEDPIKYWDTELCYCTNLYANDIRFFAIDLEVLSFERVCIISGPVKFHDFSMINYGNSMTFKYPTLRTQRVSRMRNFAHQNIEGNIKFYVGLECIFYGKFPFSMIFDIFQDFVDFSRPENQSFKFHDFSRFSLTTWTMT